MTALTRPSRPIAALAAALLALLVAAVAPGAAHASPVIEYGPGGARVVEDPLLPPRAATDLREPPAGAAARRGGARAAAGPSVGTVLRRARDRGQISQAEYHAFTRLYSEARATLRTLGGTRRRQLSSVLGTLGRIARAGRLTPSRMPALFLQLHRNRLYWRDGPIPRNGARVTFAGSPVVFEYYAGSGLQIQELANFGKANAIYKQCVNDKPECDREKLRAYLDWLVAISSRRGGFRAWEYFFAFGGGSPPWISSISQGTAIQALARGTRLLGDPAYAAAAKEGLGAFSRRPPTGLMKRGVRGGRHYLAYSFAPRLEILNQFLQSLIGLYDYEKITGDTRAKALFRLGDIAAKREIRFYDTGSWSRYSRGGALSSRGYHKLLVSFLANLCNRTKASVYCRYEQRFQGYLGPRRPGGGGDDPPASEPRPRSTGDDPWSISVRSDGNRRELVFERPAG